MARNRLRIYRVRKGVKAGSRDVEKVTSFREKPDAKTAKKFVAAGRFFWNAGMFFWKAELSWKRCGSISRRPGRCWRPCRRWASAISRRGCGVVPALREHLHRLRRAGKGRCNVVGIAIDDIGWNDVGSWNAVYELLRSRRRRECVRQRDDLATDSSGNYVDAEGKLVALLGVKDLVVVDTPDALLIADRNRAQEVGSIVKALEQRKRDDLL